jgi:hypothetical protein
VRRVGGYDRISFQSLFHIIAVRKMCSVEQMQVNIERVTPNTTQNSALLFSYWTRLNTSCLLRCSI